MLTLNDGRNELWQWDAGRKLEVDVDCSQVHFSNKVFGRSIDVDVVDGVATIPDILLQTDKELNVWAFAGTAENGYTKISKTFKVNRRNKPADYVFTPTEQTSLEEIKEKIEYLESIQDPDAIKNAVEDYLEQNPVEAPVQSVNGHTGEVKLTAEDVGAISQDDLQEATNKALEQAKESGEFKGDPGYTPQKGKDYFDGDDYVLTPEDKKEIAEMAADLVEAQGPSGGASGYPDWSHLKWYVMGDSLTAQDNDFTPKRYHDFVHEKTGIQLIVDGIGGTGYAAGASNSQSFVDRVINIPEDVDVVTIFGSGNDIRYEVDYNRPIYDALTYLCLNRPGLRVIVVPPSLWKSPDDNPNKYDKRGELWKAYCDRLQVCALACDFRYLADLYDCPPFNPNFEGHMETFFTTDPEGIHPNEAGHEALATYFYNALALELEFDAGSGINGSGGNADQSGGGLSATASALLINILRNGVYSTDQSANITALENALFNGGTAPDVPDTPDEPDEPVVTKYTIVSTLLHATSNNASASVESGASYTATITAEDGYTLDGATVSVSMGGVDITATAYANGVVTIGSVTGNVIITVNAVALVASDILYALPETTVFDGTEASVIDTGVQLFKEDIDWSIAFTANFNDRGCIFECRTEISPERGIYATGFTYNNGDWNKKIGGWYFDKQWGTNSVGMEDKLHEDKNIKVVLTHIAGTNDVVSSLYYGTTRFADKTDTHTAGFASSDKTLSIGARFNDVSPTMKYDQLFTGTIFDFTVYNRVLSADEITAYMGA